MNYETDKTVEHGIKLARESMSFLTRQLDFEQFLRLILTIEYAYQVHGLLLDDHNHEWFKYALEDSSDYDEMRHFKGKSVDWPELRVFICFKLCKRCNWDDFELLIELANLAKRNASIEQMVKRCDEYVLDGYSIL